jgi:methionyl-tRNA formyltransferase
MTDSARQTDRDAKDLRLVVMGTGPFAVPLFRRLLYRGERVLALVTQPDRPTHGRSATPRNPMRELAEEHHLEVFDPPSINTTEAQQRLANYRPDLLVVCDYGQILSSATLVIARLGGINLHGSLLPKYRGAAPIQWAIYHGETETGVSVIHMTPRLDAGPVLVERSTPIGPTETAAELEPRLAELGAEAIEATLALLRASDSPPSLPQDPALASRAPRLKKSDGEINWHRTAVEISNQVRALQPWPKAFSFWHPATGAPIRLILETVTPIMGERTDHSAPTGTILVAEKELLVACGTGSLRIDFLQAPSKRAMAAAQFLNGADMRAGERLGPETTPDAPAAR